MYYFGAKPCCLYGFKYKDLLSKEIINPSTISTHLSIQLPRTYCEERRGHEEYIFYSCLRETRSDFVPSWLIAFLL